MPCTDVRLLDELRLEPPLAHQPAQHGIVQRQLVASKGGAPDNPGWYENLVAHPDVKIQVWDKVLPVKARTATPQEKRRIWPVMTAQWPDYDKYQAGTKRDIPVVLLSPR